MTDGIGGASYELGADLRPLKKDLGSAETAIKKSGKAAESAFGKTAAGGIKKAETATTGLTKSSGGLVSKWDGMVKKGGLPGAIMGGLGIGAGLAVFSAVTMAVGAVVDTIGDAIAAAAEEEAGIARLTQAIEANVEGWDGNIDAIEEVISARERLGFADGEQRDSLAKLVSVTKDHEEALRLQRIAMDLARLRGMDLSTAGDLIGKVYGGNIGILSRYGIQLKKGTTATEALAEISRRATGQAETFANTAQGKAARAAIAWENALEELGMVLTPLMADFASFAADVIPQIVEAVGNLGDAFNNLHRFLDQNLAIEQDAEAAALEYAKAMGLTEDQIRAAIARHKEYEATLQRTRDAQAAVLATTTQLESSTGELTAIQKDLVASMARDIDLMREQGATADEVVSALAEWTGTTEDQVRAQAALHSSLGDQIGALVALAAGIDTTATATEDAASTWDTYSEAQRQALALVTAVGSQMAIANAIAATLASTTSEVTDETGEANEAFDAQATIGRAVAGTLGQVADAAGDVTISAQDMGDALELAADDLRDVRKSARDAERAWKDLADGPDINRKRIKELDEEIQKWGRRYLTWLDKGKTAQAAFALTQLNAAREERQARESVRIEMGRQKDALDKIKIAAGNIPSKKVMQLVLQGGQSAIDTLSVLQGSIAAVRGIRLNIGTLFGGGRQHGGPVQQGRAYIVGERRPEVFVPHTSGTILPSVPSGSRGQAQQNNTFNLSVQGRPVRADTPADIVRTLRRGARMGIITPRREPSW